MSGNTFGKLFQVTTYGESHGRALGCIIDGCPPQIELSSDDIQSELNRRKPGQSDVTTVAGDPRVDELREKMTIKEDKRYTDEYLEADKRSIANKIQIFFNDGSATDAIEVEYPIGHKRRREEGIPVLENKFKNNLGKIFDDEKVYSILSKCLDQDELEAMSVLDFQELFAVEENSF